MTMMILPNGNIIRRGAPLPMPVVPRSALRPKPRPRRFGAKAKPSRLYFRAIGPQLPVSLEEAVEAIVQISTPVARSIANIERPIETAEATVADIVEAVVVASGIDLNDIMSVRRSHPMVRAKHVAMWLCAKHTKLSSPQIGKRLGRDHTTVLHGVRKIDALIKLDTKEAATVRAMIVQCRIALGLPVDDQEEASS